MLNDINVPINYATKNGETFQPMINITISSSSQPSSPKQEIPVLMDTGSSWLVLNTNDIDSSLYTLADPADANLYAVTYSGGSLYAVGQVCLTYLSLGGQPAQPIKFLLRQFGTYGSTGTLGINTWRTDSFPLYPTPNHFAAIPKQVLNTGGSLSVLNGTSSVGELLYLSSFQENAMGGAEIFVNVAFPAIDIPVDALHITGYQFNLGTDCALTLNPLSLSGAWVFNSPAGTTSTGPDALRNAAVIASTFQLSNGQNLETTVGLLLDSGTSNKSVTLFGESFTHQQVSLFATDNSNVAHLLTSIALLTNPNSGGVPSMGAVLANCIFEQYTMGIDLVNHKVYLSPIE